MKVYWKCQCMLATTLVTNTVDCRWTFFRGNYAPDPSESEPDWATTSGNKFICARIHFLEAKRIYMDVYIIFASRKFCGKREGGRGGMCRQIRFLHRSVTSPIFFAITEFATDVTQALSGLQYRWQKGGFTKEWRFTVIALQLGII